MICLRKIQSAGVEKDSTFEILDVTNKSIAKAIVFHTDEPYNHILDFSTIHTDDVPATVDAIIKYAIQNNKRIMEFPQIYLYDDGTYKDDVVRFDLQNDKNKNNDNENNDGHEGCECSFAIKRQKKQYINSHLDSWGLHGKIWKYLTDKYVNVLSLHSIEDYASYYTDYPIDLRYKIYTPVLCIPKTVSLPLKKLYDIRIELFDDYDWLDKPVTPLCSTDVKAAVLQESLHIPGHSKQNVCRIVFPQTLFMIFKLPDNKSCFGDLYMSIYINGTQLVKTYEEARYFRLNKIRQYSEFDYNRIAYGYGGSTCNFIFFGSDLTFPEKSDYTELSYPILHSYVQKIRKPIVKEEFYLELCSSLECRNMISCSSIESSSNNSSSKEDMNDARGYIYLIRKREHVRMNENVYKHGKTKIITPTLVLPRLKAYDKGSELLYVRQVDVHKVDMIEANITECFRSLFTKHSDGYEYFIGDHSEMIREIERIIAQFSLYESCVSK